MVSVLLRAWRALRYRGGHWVSFAALICASPAFAQLVNCTQYSIGNGTWYATYQEAGQSYVAQLSGQACGSTGSTYATEVVITVSNVSFNRRCSQTGGLIGPYSTSIVSRTGPYCQPDSCSGKTGNSAVETFTIGWSSKSPETNSSAAVQAALVGGWIDPTTSPQCSQGCSVTVGARTDGDGYGSTVPGETGLYRLAADYVVTYGSTPCTAANNAPNNPAASAPACPGYTGTVGGKEACIPSTPASAAAPNAANNPGDGKLGNPKAGGDGSKPVDDPARSPSPAASGGGAGSLGGGNGGGPPGMGGGKFGGGTTGGTGTTGGGSATTGTNGKNTDGGACEKNPSAAGCGGAPAGDQSLYTQKTRTMTNVFDDAKTRMQASPFGSAASAFFSFGGGGTCPTFTATIPWVNASLTIDQFCSSLAANMLLLVKAALLAVSAFMAFRIAFDN